jgi:RNA polymerase sigma factor (sigma-70 family)
MSQAKLEPVLQHIRKLAGSALTSDPSDSQLLERFLSTREERAFAVLVERYNRLVWSVCWQVLHHRQDAEDAFQATFLVLARHARTIRRTETVAGWLYRVARRLATRAGMNMATQRTHEKRVRNRRVEEPGSELALSELQAVLHEELNRLPDRYRAPFYLCCLEGKTGPEAARLLSWKEGTVTGRLAEARKLLRRRLARRGFELSAILGACAVSSELFAGAPAGLVKATVKAAIAFAAGQTAATVCSASVAGLVRAGLKAAFLAKVQSAGLLLLAAGVLAYAGALTHQALAAKETPAHNPADVASAPALFPEEEVAEDSGRVPASSGKDNPTEAITVKGRVMGPDDKPLAGARVVVWTDTIKNPSDVNVRATTAQYGRFSFAVTQAELKHKATIVAKNKAYGPAWSELKGINDEEIELRLVPDDVAINGRVLDLEGKPVGGATIRLLRLQKGWTDQWISEMKRGGQYTGMAYIDAVALDGPTAVQTKKDGRFQLQGLGRQRVAWIEISGENIEVTRCFVVTRAAKVPGLRGGQNGAYTASFDHVVGPAKPIIGTVWEKGTGKPLVGITVTDNYWTKTKTDERGHYRLVGIGKKPNYIVAATGISFFSVTKWEVADTPGFDPLTVDFELKRGIVIRGRIINKETGEPVKGTVEYHAFGDNPYLKAVSAIEPAFFSQDHRGYTEADGSFFAVALPGPGLLHVLADQDNYRKTEPAADWNLLPPIQHVSKLAHALVRINPSEAETEKSIPDIALEPATSISGTVLGSDGQPLFGYFAAGLSDSPRGSTNRYERRGDSAFTIRSFDAHRPRALIFFHPDKKIGKAMVVRSAESSPLRVRLEPMSSVSGRVIDAKSRPSAGALVTAHLSRAKEDHANLPTEVLWGYYQQWPNRLEPKIRTAADGTFRLDGLMPGLRYTLIVSEEEMTNPAEALYRLERFTPADSGKTKDLGDLKITDNSAKGT